MKSYIKRAKENYARNMKKKGWVMVCVTIPGDRREDILKVANEYREDYYDNKSVF